MKVKNFGNSYNDVSGGYFTVEAPAALHLKETAVAQLVQATGFPSRNDSRIEMRNML